MTQTSDSSARLTLTDSNFDNPERRAAALIVGASGGIGRALLQQWQGDDRFSRIFATSRKPDGVEVDHKTTSLQADLCQPASLKAISEMLREQLDQHRVFLHSVVVVTGLLHDAGIRPEKQLEMLQPHAFEQLMQTNALGPLLLLQALSPLLPIKRPTRVLVLSARVGSIQDNRLGGWYSYRCSKAALNQGIQTLAIEWRRTHPGCVVTLYHPGTVDTGLSAPFSSNVPSDRLLSPQRAARYLDKVMCQRNNAEAHRFVDWAGKEVTF